MPGHGAALWLTWPDDDNGDIVAAVPGRDGEIKIGDDLQPRRWCWRNEGRNSRWLRRFRFAGWRPTGETPMDKQTETEIWDLVAGTFIAVSVDSGMAFIVASALH